MVRHGKAGEFSRQGSDCVAAALHHRPSAIRRWVGNSPGIPLDHVRFHLDVRCIAPAWNFRRPSSLHRRTQLFARERGRAHDIIVVQVLPVPPGMHGVGRPQQRPAGDVDAAELGAVPSWPNVVPCKDGVPSHGISLRLSLRVRQGRQRSFDCGIAQGTVQGAIRFHRMDQDSPLGGTDGQLFSHSVGDENIARHLGALRIVVRVPAIQECCSQVGIGLFARVHAGRGFANQLHRYWSRQQGAQHDLVLSCRGRKS
mmetsp:Transcript_22802/g.64551  ORF Transcript_22802/g.64551 Transcript_22802/m.64551 type:complete len:256 (-) Transcript_22802:1162-1929(-)